MQCYSTTQYYLHLCSRHIEAKIYKPSFVSFQMVSYSSVLTAISKVWIWDIDISINKNMVDQCVVNE